MEPRASSEGDEPVTQLSSRTPVAKVTWRKVAAAVLLLVAFGGGWIVRDAAQSRQEALGTHARLGALDSALEAFWQRHDQEMARVQGELANAQQAAVRLAHDLEALYAGLEAASKELVTVRAESESLLFRLERLEPEEAVPATRVEPAPTRPHVVTYRVRPGDSLSEIAYSLLGSPLSYRVIAEANQLDSPELILPGQLLVIPLTPAEQ